MRLRSRAALIDAMTRAGTDGRPLSCAEVARRASCSKAMVGHLRSGKVETCSPSMAARIERAVGVNTGTLFEPDVVKCAAS